MGEENQYCPYVSDIMFIGRRLCLAQEESCVCPNNYTPVAVSWEGDREVMLCPSDCRLIESGLEEEVKTA